VGAIYKRDLQEVLQVSVTKCYVFPGMGVHVVIVRSRYALNVSTRLDASTPVAGIWDVAAARLVTGSRPRISHDNSRLYLTLVTWL